MEAFGNFLVLLSFGVFLWAVVGLINPAWARLPHRMMSVAVWALSVVLAVTGSSLSPSDDTGAATSATSSGSPRPAELPAIIPEPDWTAHEYTVVREEDISSSIRIRRRLWIVAPTAQTPETRIATLMEAAIHVHRQSQPQFLSAFLLPFDTAEDSMAKIS